MKSFALAAALLLPLIAATPVEKRDLVVHTVVEEVTETVDATTTIWVKASDAAHANYQNQQPAQNQYTPHSSHHHHHHTHKPKPTPSSTPVVAPLPTTSSTSVYVPPYTPPVVPTTPTTPAVVVPTTPTTPSVVVPTTPAPVQPTTLVPKPSPVIPKQGGGGSSGGSSGGATGGACGTVGGTCTGDITYYEAGLGACGWTNDGSTEDVFALAHGMMGDQSNGNPFCGRMASIKVPGKPAVTAKLVDKCMGCDGESIDLSNHLFDQLCDEATGRLHNVEWHFTT